MTGFGSIVGAAMLQAQRQEAEQYRKMAREMRDEQIRLAFWRSIPREWRPTVPLIGSRKPNG